MLKTKDIFKIISKNNIEYIFCKYNSFSEIKDIIVDRLPLIGGGEESAYTFDESKKIYSNFLKNKSRSTKVGSVAELLVHIFLNENNFQQHCLFFNLEENSIKKGFDGVYENAFGIWYVESKSSEHVDMSHKVNVVEAIDDLKLKISGEVANDPWKNAFYHAKSYHINRQTTLLAKLNRLSKMYIDGEKIDMKNFNLIPCSTLFFDSDFSKEDIVVFLEKKLENYKYSKLIVLCFNNCIIDDILAFFGVDF